MRWMRAAMLMSEPPDYCRLRGFVTKAEDCVLGTVSSHWPTMSADVFVSSDI